MRRISNTSYLFSCARPPPPVARNAGPNVQGEDGRSPTAARCDKTFNATATLATSLLDMAETSAAFKAFAANVAENPHKPLLDRRTVTGVEIVAAVKTKRVPCVGG